MNETKWQEFDEKLKTKMLTTIKDLSVEISDEGLDRHYVTMTKCIQQTIEEVQGTSPIRWVQSVEANEGTLLRQDPRFQ